MSELLIEAGTDTVTLTLNRPAEGNLLTQGMAAEMMAALAAVGPDAKLVVLRAAGSDFCRGRQSPPIDRATASAREFRSVIAEPALALYQAMKDCPVPILGVIRGQALGVGCAIAGLCDISLSAEDATFQVPEMNHGIPPTLVMAALAGRVPFNGLSYLVFSRTRISAAKAEALGIVSRCVPAAALESEAETLAREICSCPAASLHAVKEYMRLAPRLDAQSANSLAANLIATVLSSHRAPPKSKE